MDCSLPGSSVHGIFQAIVLEWIAISFSRGSSRPRDWTQVSRIVDRCFTVWATKMSNFNHLSKCLIRSTQGETHLVLSDLEIKSSGKMSSPCNIRTIVWQFVLCLPPTAVFSQIPTLRLVWLKSRSPLAFKQLHCVILWTFFLCRKFHFLTAWTSGLLSAVGGACGSKSP